MASPATLRIEADLARLKDVRRFVRDGITDSRDPARRFYGEERLLELVGGACGRPAETIAEAIVADVTGFRGEAEPFDDLTLLVVERRPA